MTIESTQSLKYTNIKNNDLYAIYILIKLLLEDIPLENITKLANHLIILLYLHSFYTIFIH